MNVYLESISGSEDRDERIASLADDLLQQGKQCYPYTPVRLRDGIAEADNETLVLLAMYLNCHSRCTGSLKISNFLAQGITRLLTNAVVDYWAAEALTQAEEKCDG